MRTEVVLLKIEEAEGVAQALKRAAATLDPAGGELTLDFSSVRRIDSEALRALENLAQRAEEKAVKVGLQGVDTVVYKALKLAKLTRRFSFAG
jgi:anti-anti-sigma regulatory factor